MDSGAVVGSLLRTRERVRPIYVSIGHRIALEAAERWALRCARGYRVPEPTRRADALSREAKRRMLAGTIFEGAVATGELEALQRTRRVTQAVLVEGRNRVRIHEPSREAPDGFEPAVPTLEDAYFVLMHRKPNGAEAGDLAVPVDARGRPLVPQRVPEARPTPLQDAFIHLSIVVLVCGANGDPADVIS